jgi:hypothetical protein
LGFWDFVFWMCICYWGFCIVRDFFKDTWVRHSEHMKLIAEKEHAWREYQELREKWNRLVGQINAKGGLHFLNNPPPAALTKQDVRSLLQLCHPDKHQGRELAQEMTRKLLAMKEKL